MGIMFLCVKKEVIHLVSLKIEKHLQLGVIDVFFVYVMPQFKGVINYMDSITIAEAPPPPLQIPVTP